MTEAEAFSLCPFEAGTDVEVKTLAGEPSTNTSAAIVVERTGTNGSLTVLLARDFGMASKPVAGNSYQCPRPNMNFTDFEPERPYVMLKHTKRILVDMVAARSLLSVDDNASSHLTSELAADRNRLSWIVLANGTDDFLVAISNPSWDVQPFAIQPGPALGNVQLDVTELHVDESERAARMLNTRGP